MGKILAVGVAATAGTPLPLLPLQVLYINIINDVFPALALGAGRGIPEVMQEPPRDPQEPVITRRSWTVIGGYGVMIALTVLGVFFLALYLFDMNYTGAVTVSFLTLSIARLLHVFNMRRPGSGVLINEITRNPHVWAAVALCMALLLGAIYVPFVAEVLSVAPPQPIEWLLIAAGSLAPLVLGQLLVSLSREHKP